MIVERFNNLTRHLFWYSKNYKKIDYFTDLHQSIEQLEQGKIVIKTIDELEEMES